MTVRRDRMMAALILMYSRTNGEGLWVCSLELWAVQTLRSKCPPSVSFADISPSGQCYSVKRFTQAYVITTCAFFVCKKKLRFTKKYKNIKKRLDKSSKI